MANVVVTKETWAACLIWFYSGLFSPVHALIVTEDDATTNFRILQTVENEN